MNKLYEDGVLTVYLSGEIDHHCAAGIREETDVQIKQLQPSIFKLNFQNVKFMDSSGIGLIIGRYRAMRLIGGELYIESVPKHLKRIIALSGISSLGIVTLNSK